MARCSVKVSGFRFEGSCLVEGPRGREAEEEHFTRVAFVPNRVYIYIYIYVYIYMYIYI